MLVVIFAHLDACSGNYIILLKKYSTQKLQFVRQPIESEEQLQVATGSHGARSEDVRYRGCIISRASRIT